MKREISFAAIRAFTERVTRGDFHSVVTYLAFKETIGEKIVAGCKCPLVKGRPDAGWFDFSDGLKLVCCTCHKPYITAPK